MPGSTILREPYAPCGRTAAPTGVRFAVRFTVRFETPDFVPGSASERAIAGLAEPC